MNRDELPISPRLVLVVDDEPRMRDLLTRSVTELGYAVLTARTAEQAAKHIADSRPGIVLLDLNLPGTHGLDFLQQLRAHDDKTQVIILTGFGSLDAAQVAIRHNVTDFLTKPFPLEALEQALARAVAKLLGKTVPTVDLSTPEPPDVKPSATLEELERVHILAALERHQGNRAAAARELQISERTLYYRLAKYEQGS